MNGLTTSAGQLLSASVAGTPATVSDLMFSAHLYLTTLERQFGSADALVASFHARQKELRAGGTDLARTELRLVTKWKNAHAHADHKARVTLSDPDNQEFVIVLAGQ